MTGDTFSSDTATNIVTLVGNGPNYGVTGRISFVSNLLKSDTGVGLTVADGNAQSAGLPASFVFLENDAILYETGTSVVVTGGNVDIDGVLVSEGTATTAAFLDEQALAVDSLTSQGLSVTNDINTVSNGGGFSDLSSVPASFTQGQFSGDGAKVGDGGGVYLASGSVVTFTNITTGDDTALYGGGIYVSAGASDSLNSLMISNDVATNGRLLERHLLAGRVSDDCQRGVYPRAWWYGNCWCDWLWHHCRYRQQSHHRQYVLDYRRDS